MTKNCRFNLAKLGGLFSKMTHEGVSATLGHWITDGRLRLELRGRERRSAAGNSADTAALPLPTARRSPARSIRALQAMVCPSESTGGERR